VAVRLCKFESCPGHHKKKPATIARMAELVDALVSGTSIGNNVQVRVLFRVRRKKKRLSSKKASFFILWNIWKLLFRVKLFEILWINLLLFSNGQLQEKGFQTQKLHYRLPKCRRRHLLAIANCLR